MNLVRGWRTFARDQSGQTLIYAGLCMALLMSFLALAIDAGHLRFERQRLQTAADAAALAAGLEIRICGSLPNCPAMQAAAQNALSENGYTGATLITNCTGTAGSALTLQVNDPPCLLGTRDANRNSTRYVEAVLSEQGRTYFGRLVGFDKVTLSARAEAERYPGLPCIYALDPAGASAIAVDIALASTCPVIDESSSAGAFTCLAAATVSAQQVRVTGGTAGLLCSINPKPRTSVQRPVPNDPLAYLLTPTIPACGTSTASPYHGSATQLTIAAGKTAVLYPDKSYCGGIVIAVGATVTLQPGTYVLQSNNSGLLGTTVGGLSLAIGASVTGTGVTFFNKGPQGAVTFIAPSALGILGKTTLTAPTTGTYGGMLFMQAPADTQLATLLASGPFNTKLEGSSYFPTASVNYAVSGTTTYNILVAKDIHFIASFGLGSSFNNNYSALSSGSPLNGDADVLVQ